MQRGEKAANAIWLTCSAPSSRELIDEVLAFLAVTWGAFSPLVLPAFERAAEGGMTEAISAHKRMSELSRTRVHATRAEKGDTCQPRVDHQPTQCGLTMALLKRAYTRTRTRRTLIDAGSDDREENGRRAANSVTSSAGRVEQGRALPCQIWLRCVTRQSC